MNNRIKRQTSPPQEEQPSPSSSIASPNKFQRTAKRGIRTPEDTNVTSEISEPIANQPVKSQNTEKNRLISRTNRPTKEIIKSPLIEQSQVSKFQRTTAPNESPKGDVKISFNQTKKAETEPSQKSLPLSQSKVQQPGAALKKSNVSCLIMSRLLRGVLGSTFGKLKQNRVLNRLKFTGEANCLLLNASEFARRYQLKLYSLCLERIKMIGAKQAKEQFLGLSQVAKGNYNKSRQYILKLSETLFFSKTRQAFNKLKKIYYQKSNAAKAINIFFNWYEKKSIRKIFRELKQKSIQAYRRRKQLMNTIVDCYRQSSKEQLAFGFSQIMVKSSKTQTKAQEKTTPLQSPRGMKVNTGTRTFASTNQAQVSEVTKKIERLTSDNTTISSQVQQKESQIQSKKKENANQVQQLKKSVQELKASKKKVQKDLADKKSAHQNIKRKLQAAGTQPLTAQDLVADEADTTKLQLLQKIYSQIYKVKDEDVKANLLELMRQHRVDINSKDHIIEQWRLIRQKIDIQRKIDLYESSILGGSSSNNDQGNILKLVKQENQMVRNLIRNFIKERYLWGEVQKFVAAVL